MVRLDLSAADPDFFVSNCHKWLHVPRGCAFLYAPARNQPLLRTTLATSHGYAPEPPSPLPPTAKSPFVTNFNFVGTRDNAPQLCVADAVAWRADVCGGEDAILDYLWALNKKGIAIVARALGTTYLDNATGTLTNCAMGNVALPVRVAAAADEPNGTDADADADADVVSVAPEHQDLVFKWICDTLMADYKTFISLFVMDGRYWMRLSSQIYLDEGDYEAAGDILKDLCARVARREYLSLESE
ncbi:hypothetical protein E4U21_004762 [Claviceps maximensis]|nr:hypothetical protein E4U21_004762 [Claviceps maximensis]